MNEGEIVLEPTVTRDYLLSSDLLVPAVESALDSDELVYFQVKALTNTPYFLKCYRCPSNEEIDDVFIELVDNKNDNRANSIHHTDQQRSHLRLSFSKRENFIRAAGWISNKTRTSRYPMKNLSGVFAPIEDAVYKVVARKFEQDVRAIVKIQGNLDSKRVVDYMTRGYSPYDPQFAGGSEYDVMMLYKDFSAPK